MIYERVRIILHMKMMSSPLRRRHDVADGGHGFRGDEEQGVGEGDAAVSG